MKMDRTTKTVFGITGLIMLVYLAGLGVVIYVAYHFISKLW